MRRSASACREASFFFHSIEYRAMRTRPGISTLLAAVPTASAAARSARTDLQGVWSFSTLTPLERPAEFAGKEFLTEAEARAFAKRTVDRNNSDTRDTSNPDG